MPIERDIHAEIRALRPAIEAKCAQFIAAQEKERKIWDSGVREMFDLSCRGRDEADIEQAFFSKVAGVYDAALQEKHRLWTEYLVLLEQSERLYAEDLAELEAGLIKAGKKL